MGLIAEAAKLSGRDRAAM
jgi:hypothetical protein